MIVESDMRHDLGCGIIPNLKIEQHSTPSQEEVLFYGYASTVNRQLQEKYKHYQRKVLLNLWEPTQLIAPPLEGRDVFQQVSYFDEIYSICPYTIKWFKEQYDDNRYKYIHHPFDDDIEHDYSKIWDVTWFGGFHGMEHYQIANILHKFNCIIMSNEYNQFVTHCSVPHKQKLMNIGRAKISIIFNQLCLNDNSLKNLQNIPFFRENKAFEALQTMRAPQYKARMSEAAQGRSLQIVVRDRWNVCEDHWRPGVDFIYSDIDDLEETIKMVLNDYEEGWVQSIIESAYERCKNHTPKATYDMIKEGRQVVL